MRRYHFLPLLVLIWMIQGCVPTKRLVYLQPDGSRVEAGKKEVYRFKPLDRIYIDIKTIDDKINKLLSGGQQNTNNLSGGNTYFFTYHVDNKGFIELPVLGKIRAEGKTPDSLKNEIKGKLLHEFFRNPEDVFVKVMPAGIVVTVLGEVGHTGTLNILDDDPDVLKALAEAGDIKLTGDRRQVVVIRDKPDGTKEIASLDLTKQSALNSPFFHLKNNDVVYVKPLPQKSIGTGTTLISTLTTVFSIVSFAFSVYLFTTRTR